MYSMRHTIATSDIGADGLLKPGAAALLMQDCSTFQYERETKFSDFINAHNIGVFLASRQIDFTRRPAYGEDVEIWTGIHGCRGFYGLRNTTIRDADGDLCAISYAIGAFVDRETGKPFVLPRETYDGLVDCDPLPMEYLPRKIAVPTGLVFREIRRDSVVPGYMDANKHLNAGRAFDMAAAVIDYPIRRMSVEYKNQAKPGASLILERADVSPTHSFMRLRSPQDEVFSVYEFQGQNSFTIYD